MVSITALIPCLNPCCCGVCSMCGNPNNRNRQLLEKS